MKLLSLRAAVLASVLCSAVQALPVDHPAQAAPAASAGLLDAGCGAVAGAPQPCSGEALAAQGLPAAAPPAAAQDAAGEDEEAHGAWRLLAVVVALALAGWHRHGRR